MKMNLNTENTLTELVLQLQLRVNGALKRKGLRLVKFTRLEYIDACSDVPQAAIFFNIECWSTRKLLIMQDGRIVRGDMNGEGLCADLLVKSIITEQTEWQARIALHQSCKPNEIVFNNYKVKVIGDSKWQGREATYEIQLLNGRKSKWYGPSPQYALENAAPWLKTKVKSVRLIQAVQGE